MMTKIQQTCRDCGWCEYAAGMSVGLCWRPYQGPQVVNLSETGQCGYGSEPDEFSPSAHWLAAHEHDASLLVEIQNLLRWSGLRRDTQRRLVGSDAPK